MGRPQRYLPALPQRQGLNGMSLLAHRKRISEHRLFLTRGVYDALNIIFALSITAIREKAEKENRHG